MNNTLIKEFEAFEGLGAHIVDDTMFEGKEEDDSGFMPANASRTNTRNQPKPTYKPRM
jgi:hypothetical protein